MKIIQWFVIIILFIFWLAEDEVLHIEESIQEREFEMPELISQEKLSERSFAIIYAGGSVTINDQNMGVIELSAQEAYNLLDVLYRHEHILRQREDTVPLPAELPEWAQPEERHDHLCRCQGCNYDGPDPTEEEGQRIMAEMGPEPLEAEQWQASGTCQVEPTHTGRDVFRCDGCGKMCCNECGETIEDRWLCERCLAQEVAYLF